MEQLWILHSTGSRGQEHLHMLRNEPKQGTGIWKGRQKAEVMVSCHFLKYIYLFI